MLTFLILNNVNAQWTSGGTAPLDYFSTNSYTKRVAINSGLHNQNFMLDIGGFWTSGTSK